MDNYEAVLQELIKAGGIEGATLVSLDGLPIASVLPPDAEEDKVAAMSAAILSLGEKVVEELKKGTLEQITIKGNSGYIVITGIGKDAVLTTLTNADAKLGLIYMEIKKAQEKLKELI
ncbi:roadblock/LC7 domain-containing protein [Aquifex sp.]